ncbi:hypothetical protein NKH53_30510 [Mesorhizobium australicum]|uniref:hypothetical protein n=1 Tax=Mesorhizobium australicum TaxID=536018 RepID=UPI00333B9E3E
MRNAENPAAGRGERGPSVAGLINNLAVLGYCKGRVDDALKRMFWRSSATAG